MASRGQKQRDVASTSTAAAAPAQQAQVVEDVEDEESATTMPVSKLQV
jgi:hypothetical protein